jgi:acyl-CoA reductase-like NAD-dependent aldehyde dehydrogenase
MEINEAGIRELVEQVLSSLDGKIPGMGSDAVSAKPAAGSGVFEDIETAIRAARSAHDELAARTLDTRRRMIAAMRQEALKNVERIAELAVAETGMGRRQDKTLKNRIAAEMTPGVEDVRPGVFTDDHGLTLVERAPYGVIGSITPSTNPTEMIINNSIGMIAAGNAVVFNPHPSARKVSAFTIDLLNRAIVSAGGPANLLCALAEPTIQSAQALFEHPGVNLLVVEEGHRRRARQSSLRGG